jgi:uncharacterized protein (DUF305 family)
VNENTRRFAVLVLLCFAPMMCAWRQVSQPRSTKSAADTSWSELSASMGKMHAATASVEPSGDSDLDFAKLMLPHHQAAIDMAKTELLYGKNPQMRRLAQEIITDQQSEIEVVQFWLKQHQPDSRNADHGPASDANREH